MRKCRNRTVVIVATVAASASPITAQANRVSTSSSDLLKFAASYLAAAGQVQHDYSNLEITASRTQFDEVDQAKATDDVQIFAAKGEASLLSVRQKDSDPNDLFGTGSRFVRGGSPALFFSASKKPAASGYVFERFGPVADDMFNALVRPRCLPAYFPYCILESSIAELLRSNDYVVYSSTDEISDGRRLLKAVITCKNPNFRTSAIDLTLDSDWCLLEYTVRFGNEAICRGQAKYADGDYPRPIVSVEFWSQTAKSETKINRMHFDISKYFFREPVKEIFTPAGVGLTVTPTPEDDADK